MYLIVTFMGNSGLIFFASRRRHAIFDCDWSSVVCSSDLLFDEVQKVLIASRYTLLDGAFRQGNGFLWRHSLLRESAKTLNESVVLSHRKIRRPITADSLLLARQSLDSRLGC